MNIANYLDRHFQDVYALYQDIVNISSQSSDKEGIDRVGAMIADFMTQKGFAVETYCNPVAGNGLLIHSNPQGSGKRIVFIAHMDTVHKKGAFPEPLFREESGKAYGPGVLDCKGGIAVGILTMLALRDCGYSAPITFVLAPDEEVSFSQSGQRGIDFIKENVQNAEYVMVLESGTRNKLVTGRKGVIRYEITIHGKASHAGHAYDLGISAVKEACHKILALEQNSNSDYGITYNCGTISGGEIPNSVPQLCKFVLDVRFKNPQQEREAVAAVESIVNTPFLPGTNSEMKLLSRRDAMEETEANMALFRLLQQISAEYGLEDLTSYVSGGASDAAFPSAMGIPTVCGMGIVGLSQHTPREEADISSIRQRSILLGNTMFALNP